MNLKEVKQQSTQRWIRNLGFQGSGDLWEPIRHTYCQFERGFEQKAAKQTKVDQEFGVSGVGTVVENIRHIRTAQLRTTDREAGTNVAHETQILKSLLPLLPSVQTLLVFFCANQCQSDSAKRNADMFSSVPAVECGHGPISFSFDSLLFEVVPFVDGRLSFSNADFDLYPAVFPVKPERDEGLAFDRAGGK